MSQRAGISRASTNSRVSAAAARTASRSSTAIRVMASVAWWTVPVQLEVHAETRLPEPVEVAAYYIVSEALTNTAKHACASAVHVAIEAHDSVLELTIRDDGSGGTDPARGSGLIGLADRVDALGGMIEVASPVGTAACIVYL
jgi:signal transduction histidine kinase